MQEVLEKKTIPAHATFETRTEGGRIIAFIVATGTQHGCKKTHTVVTPGDADRAIRGQ